MDYLTQVKALLMLSDKTFEKQKELLTTIVDNSKARLLLRLGSLVKDNEIPHELSYIVIEVTVKRYNRLNNEAMASYSQDGESITFKDDDFAEFERDIQNWIDNNKEQKKIGTVKFIGGYNAIR